MATTVPTIAKVLIQVGNDEPVEVGTIEIPVNFVHASGGIVPGSALRKFTEAADGREHLLPQGPNPRSVAILHELRRKLGFA